MSKQSISRAKQDILNMYGTISGLNIIVYDRNHNLIYSSSESAILSNMFFTASDYLDRIYNYASKSCTPLILSSYIGMVWEVVVENTADSHIYILGPVFYNPYSDAQMELRLKKYEKLNASIYSRKRLLNFMKGLPVMGFHEFCNLAIMLHYGINHEQIQLSDFQTLKDDGNGFTPTYNPGEASDLVHAGDTKMDDSELLYKHIAICEKLMLDEVASGKAEKNAEAIKKLTDAGSFFLMPTLNSKMVEPLRLKQNSTLTYAVLACHTAISNGASPITAYGLLDTYTNKIESLHSPLGLNTIYGEIHQQYCELVHQYKSAKEKYSEEVLMCIDFLKSHPTTVFSLEYLGKMCNYAPYYLSRKFKEEVGISPKKYFRKIRINHALLLLNTSTYSISQIAEILNYHSYPQFNQDFKEETGHSPSFYRRKKEE